MNIYERYLTLQHLWNFVSYFRERKYTEGVEKKVLRRILWLRGAK
jgi:hypothetical protein